MRPGKLGSDVVCTVREHGYASCVCRPPEKSWGTGCLSERFLSSVGNGPARGWRYLHVMDENANVIRIYNIRFEIDSFPGGRKSGSLCHSRGRSRVPIPTAWSRDEGHALMQRRQAPLSSSGPSFFNPKLTSLDSRINRCLHLRLSAYFLIIQ